MDPGNALARILSDLQTPREDDGTHDEGRARMTFVCWVVALWDHPDPGTAARSALVRIDRLERISPATAIFRDCVETAAKSFDSVTGGTRRRRRRRGAGHTRFESR